jgi:hypothetical protein
MVRLRTLSVLSGCLPSGPAAEAQPADNPKVTISPFSVSGAGGGGGGRYETTGARLTSDVHLLRMRAAVYPHVRSCCLIKHRSNIALPVRVC